MCPVNTPPPPGLGPGRRGRPLMKLNQGALGRSAAIAGKPACISRSLAVPSPTQRGYGQDYSQGRKIFSGAGEKPGMGLPQFGLLDLPHRVPGQIQQ
jgi:hypothetical protein